MSVVKASAATEWLTAIGTFGAVLVALGLYRLTALRERRKAPKLTLEKDQSSIDNASGWPSVSMAVRNAAGKDAAHDVQVSVEAVTEVGVMRHPSNTTLRWSNIFEREIALRPMTIPAGGTRRVDLGAFIDATRPGRNDAPAFRVEARTGSIGGNYLESPPCVFELTVSATNCDVTAWRAELRWEPASGDWKKPMNVELTVDGA